MTATINRVGNDVRSWGVDGMFQEALEDSEEWVVLLEDGASALS